MQQGIIQRMSGKNEIVAEQLGKVRQDIRDLWDALRDDPKKHAGNKRAWSILSGALTAVTAMVARKAAIKIWMRLTGELPPPSWRRRRRRPSLRKEMSA